MLIEGLQQELTINTCELIVASSGWAELYTGQDCGILLIVLRDAAMCASFSECLRFRQDVPHEATYWHAALSDTSNQGIMVDAQQPVPVQSDRSAHRYGLSPIALVDHNGSPRDINSDVQS